MSILDALEFFARFLWPVLLAWNVYLYRQIQTNNRALFEFRLAVARDYMSKRDLEKMFDDWERRIDIRLKEYIQFAKS